MHGSKETLQEKLMIRENFWIQKRKTLVPFGLNQEFRNKKDLHAAPFSF